MNTPVSEYLMLMRGTQFDDSLSPQAMQEAMRGFTEWFDRLAREGKLRGGQPLAHDGKVITGKKVRAFADGPFAEAKEAVGGYIILTVGNLDEAVALVEECPMLDLGITVELRPIIGQCAEMQRFGLQVETVAG